MKYNHPKMLSSFFTSSLVALTLTFATAHAEPLDPADAPPETANTSTSASAKPLFFQADKNHIQVLPQRFEYGVLEENQIKIGDVLVDSASFGFQVGASTSSAGTLRARFVWPQGLVKNGMLFIRNNTGKSIWSSPIRTQEVKIVKKAEAADGEASVPSNLRTQLAEYTVDRLPAAVVEEMKYLPFMTFCVSKAAEGTRILLCSREVYFGAVNGKYAIRPRSSTKKAASVEVNGRTVSNQGIIFLNDETQNIGFRASAASGAIIEIETRMKPVDFKDVILSEDKKNLILTASGTEPVAEEKIQRLSANEWRATVDATRPVLYLKGAGDIPMRQEFYVKGDVPTEGHRPKLSPDTFSRLYRSHVTFNGTAAPNTTVSSTAKNSRVEMHGSEFNWSIEDIPAGKVSRQYLQVSPSFTAAYDVHREFAWEAELGGEFLVPASQATGFASLTWRFQNFLGLDSNWTELRWGLRATQEQLLTEKTGEANLSLTDIELLWRANAGFHFIDPTWGLSLVSETLKSSVFSTNTFGVGAYYSAEPMPWIKNWFQWQETRFTYLLPSTGDVQLKSGIKFETIAFKSLDPRWLLQCGVGFMQYTFDPGEVKPQVTVKAGAVYRF